MSVNHRIKNRAGPVTESLPENYKRERFRPRLIYRRAIELDALNYRVLLVTD